MSFIHPTFRWLLLVFFFLTIIGYSTGTSFSAHLLVAQTLVSSEPIPRSGWPEPLLESEESEVGGLQLHFHQQ